MFPTSTRAHEASGPVCAFDSGESFMLACMRLILSLCILLTVYIDPSHFTLADRFSWFVLCGFVVYSVFPLVHATLMAPNGSGTLIYWIDIAWTGLIVYLTHGTSSIFAPVFFFAIAASSFRRGFDEGARVTLASVALYIACGLMTKGNPDVPRLLLRSAFILTFGYMSAHWGETKVRSARRLALLRDVIRLPNPRFGSEYAIASLLEKTLAFFGANKCVLVMPANGSSDFVLRVAHADHPPLSATAEIVQSNAIAPLMDFSRDQLVVRKGYRWPSLSRSVRTRVGDIHDDTWTTPEGDAAEQVVALLEARSFISAPLVFCNADARIFVTSDRYAFSKADALFLSHVVTQAIPAIENIELLDRMASEAAARERQKISLDLHDTTIQPYIGLKLGLHAMRNKAAPGNPLINDLDKLIDMTAEVVRDLRRYAGSFRTPEHHDENSLISQLRHKAEQFKEFHGIDIGLTVDGNIRATDRLAAEVSQMVSEGLSNICKHTDADRGSVNIALTDRTLRIRIENENRHAPGPAFVPRSISERAAGLGGKATVSQTACGHTSVDIEIPI